MCVLSVCNPFVHSPDRVYPYVMICMYLLPPGSTYGIATTLSSHHCGQQCALLFVSRKLTGRVHAHVYHTVGSSARGPFRMFFFLVYFARRRRSNFPTHTYDTVTTVPSGHLFGAVRRSTIEWIDDRPFHPLQVMPACFSLSPSTREYHCEPTRVESLSLLP